jgi:chemotaxis protein methyltransferase CheR
MHLSDAAYNKLKDHLIQTTGMAFYADRDKLLTDVIGVRLSDLGLHDCFSYGEFLADGEAGIAEMEVLITKLTIGETYFFRDESQFAAIRDIILPAILERNKSTRHLRIWSAGCSTGAEPYSLAILLADQLADQIAGWQIEIHATDLNRRYLREGAEGKFREWALRCTPEEVKRNCFSNEGPIWTIHPRYKERISFRHMNLVENESPSPLSDGTQFDLILCRNVMIYFAPEVSHRLIGRLHQSLGDDGWLVVGASEHTPDGYQAFRTVRAAGATLYQKMALPARQIEVAPEVFVARPPNGELDHSTAAQPDLADMQGLRQLTDRGEWRGAAEYGQRLLTQDRLNPAIHFYQALIFENLGIADESERSLRHAIYLDRHFALAHYHLGLFLKRDRQTGAAARSFGNVLKVLTGMPDDAVVTGGSGVTVTGLKELAKMHLETSNV